MKKGIIFLSHVHEDGELANAVRDWLTDRFAGSVDVFVSSNPKSVPGGDDWWDKLREKLKNADFVLTLMTQRSVNRPWVYFECGGGYFLEKTVIPICLGHITKANLPQPISHLQAYELEQSEDAKALFEQIRERFDLDAEDDGREVAARLAQVEKALSQSEPKAKSDLQPVRSTDEISDVDARNILETWLRKRAPRLNEEAIFYEEADKEAGLPRGTSKRLLPEVAYRCAYRIIRKGAQTILLKKRSQSPPLGGHRMTRENLSQY